jgi:lipopolysaccharide export system protein LptA
MRALGDVMSNKPATPLRFKLTTRLALICLTCLSFSNYVMAESADRDKPIDLEADTVKVDDAKQISTYSGNVILTQGTLIIRADTLIVREDTAGFQHSTSLGNPTTFKQKLEGKEEYMQGSAQRIEYDGRMDKVQLYTKAWVKRGEDIVHGDYISYDANAEYAEVIGGAKSADGVTSSGRVRAVIQPKNKQATTLVIEDTKPNNSKINTPITLPAPVKDSRFSRTLQLSTDQK